MVYFVLKVGAASFGGFGASELFEYFVKFFVYVMKLVVLVD